MLSFIKGNHSYFGARNHDSDLSVWLSAESADQCVSIDPIADKYPSMSAYMYCAGNPVMLVDPDGNRIILVAVEAGGDGSDNTIHVEYRGGILYNMDGSEYSGNNEYFLKVQEDLNTLAGLSRRLNRRINRLVKSKHTHYVEHPSEARNRPGNADNMNMALDDPAYYNNEGTSTFTLYNPYNWTKRSDGEIRNPIFALAHDLLGHGFFRDIGRVIFGKTNGIPNEEIQAVRAENIARKAYNKKVEPTKIRDTYHKTSLPNRMKNKSRTGDPESNQY